MKRYPGDGRAAALFVTPNLVAYTLFIVVPAVSGVVIGFYSWDLFSTPTWVGLANYSRLLHDPMVGQATWHTVLFVGLGVAPTVFIGFLCASLLDWQARFVGGIRLLYFLPLVVSTAVAGVLWSTLFSPSYGLINRMLGLVGITGPTWLASTTWALPALTLVIIWLSLPLVIILYLAGLQRVPQQIHEAARVDGAGVWLRLWAITWPNVRSTTVLVLVLEILQFLAAPFEVALIMTYGGPLDSTTSLSFYAYRQAFELGRMGYASAISMVQFFVLLVVVAVFAAMVRRWGAGGLSRRRFDVDPRRASTILRLTAALSFGLVLVFPLVYLISLSLMSAADAVASPPHLIPPSVHLDNFSAALTFLSLRTILNSFVFTLGVLILQLMLALPAGFALAQIPFRGARPLTLLFVVPMFLPNNISVIPLFVVTLKLHLVDSYAGLILPIVGSTAFGTLLFRQFFTTLPAGLVEAARIDGAGWVRTLRSIALPQAKPAIAAYSVITFLTAWNMYIWPQIVATSKDLQVVPVALAPLARSTYNIIPPSVGAAAAVVSALPVAVIFLCGQRWFINGVAGTGLE